MRDVKSIEDRLKTTADHILREEIPTTEDVQLLVWALRGRFFIDSVLERIEQLLEGEDALEPRDRVLLAKSVLTEVSGGETSTGLAATDVSRSIALLGGVKQHD